MDLSRLHFSRSSPPGSSLYLRPSGPLMASLPGETHFRLLGRQQPARRARGLPEDAQPLEVRWSGARQSPSLSQLERELSLKHRRVGETHVCDMSGFLSTGWSNRLMGLCARTKRQERGQLPRKEERPFPPILLCPALKGEIIPWDARLVPVFLYCPRWKEEVGKKVENLACAP